MDFNQLLRFYPKSRYTPDARQRMIYIRNALARHELQIAQYYFTQGGFVASANRANEIVQHYQKTPSVKPALLLMVKSYRKLGLTKEANDALKILELNFPNVKVRY